MGPIFTVNAFAVVLVPPSGFTTVMLRAPVAAFAEIVTFAVICVALTNVMELTVMPVPEKLTVGVPPLLEKPVPLMVRV